MIDEGYLDRVRFDFEHIETEGVFFSGFVLFSEEYFIEDVLFFHVFVDFL